MKLFFLILAIVVTNFAKSQVSVDTLHESIKLTMPTPDEPNMPGTRGASVVWHPIQKKYYAAMAGNSAFPIAMFNSKGILLNKENELCKIDVRGLWFNTTNNFLEGNAYEKLGWFNYVLFKDGSINEMKIIEEGAIQPNDNSVGAYDFQKNIVYFLNTNSIISYSRINLSERAKININHGKVSEDGTYNNNVDDFLATYNNTTVIFTGIKNQEFGLLNIAKRQIELYNLKGNITKKLILPYYIKLPQSFCFSYTNNTYFIFEIESRTWFGLQ